MKDVTRAINLYRECARNLWNLYLHETISSRNEWDLSDEFDDICTLLFSSLVLVPNKCASYKKSHSYDKNPQPLSCLRVVPSSEGGVPIQINREITRSAYWDFPLSIVKPVDVDLRLIDLFDFDLLGFRDLRFCQVRIIGSPTYPEIIGRDALLGSNDVKIMLDESLLR